MSFLFKTFRPRKSRPTPPADMPPDYPAPDPPGPDPAPVPPAGGEGVPGEPGPFRFPNGAQGIRLSPAFLSLLPVGMAYWNNLNAHAGQPDIYAFLGTTSGVWLFRIDKATLHPEPIVNMRPGTGEGWYFDKLDPHQLFLQDGPRLIRHHILTHQEEVVWDISASRPGHYLWQCSSSHDGQHHAAILKEEGTYRPIGSLALRHGREHFLPIERYPYDEPQIDKSGRWLLIKEAHDNRIRDLDTGQDFWIPDVAGAVGHSDTGFGYVVGEENQSDPGGVIRRWNLLPGGPQDAGAVYATDWTPMSRYVSHCNAPQPFILLTLADTLYKVYLDGRPTQIVCPTLWAGGGDETKPRAALDPHCQWAIWTTNYQGGPLVAFLARLP